MTHGSNSATAPSHRQLKNMKPTWPMPHGNDKRTRNDSMANLPHKLREWNNNAIPRSNGSIPGGKQRWQA